MVIINRFPRYRLGQKQLDVVFLEDLITAIHEELQEIKKSSVKTTRTCYSSKYTVDLPYTTHISIYFRYRSECKLGPSRYIGLFLKLVYRR